MPNSADSSGKDTSSFVRKLSTRLQILYYWSGICLRLERLFLFSWQAVLLAILYICLALVDAPLHLSPSLWQMISLGFLVAVAERLWRHRSYLQPPTEANILHRMEQGAHRPHTPLQTLADTLSNTDDPVTKALWQEHQRRQMAQLSDIHATGLRSVLLEKDPLGLRFMVLVLFAVLLIAQAGTWRTQIDFALQNALPSFSASPSELNIDVWVDPPKYTGIATQHFMTQGIAKVPTDQEIVLPEGSVLHIRIGDSFWTPKIHANGTSYAARQDEEDTGYSLELPLITQNQHQKPEKMILGISRFLQWDAKWNIVLVPDQVPQIDFSSLDQSATPDTIEADDEDSITILFGTGDPSEEAEETDPSTSAADEDAIKTESGSEASLKVGYKITDDYGVETLQAKLELDFASPFFPYFRTSPEQTLTLPTPSFDEETHQILYQGALEQLLGAHPWAGFPVKLTLIATDAHGNIGRSETRALTLPKQKFSNPVAAQLQQIRERLFLDPVPAAPRVRPELRALAARPWLYQKDTGSFLGLYTTYLRLDRHPTEITYKEVPLGLWDLMEHIESTGLNKAYENMLQAQQDLMNALNNPNSSDEEIAALTDALEKAMQNYLQQLQRKYEQMLADGQITPPTAEQLQNQPRLNLKDLMEQLRNFSENGARDKAEQLLSDMQRMMKNARPQNIDPRAYERAQQAQKAIEDLQALIQKQEQLLDDTTKEHQKTNPPPSPEEQNTPQQQQTATPENAETPQPPSDTKDLEEGLSSPLVPSEKQAEADGTTPDTAEDLQNRQSDLTDNLSELSERFQQMLDQQASENLNTAENYMAESENALAYSELEGAIESQKKALEYLQQGLQENVQRMIEQAQGSTGGLYFQGQNQQNNGHEDPFGKSRDNDIKVPDGEEKRSREILRELRKRSGERERPEIEHDYIDRLLENFN